MLPTATTASGAGARYKAWGARVQTLLIPLMIAGSVLSSGETVLLPRSPRQVAAMGPKGALKELHPSRRTLERWKKHFENYGEMPWGRAPEHTGTWSLLAHHQSIGLRSLPAERSIVLPGPLQAL